ALLDTKYNDDNFRGRLALHTGTYVESNYAAEPQLLKNIFEASAGFKLFDKVWIDAGIFPAHIGFESAISKDNWTYSRSLMADYSPYYEAGVKVSTNFTDNFSGQFLVLNGWQNIKENNNSKAVGFQFQYKPLDKLTLTYNNFLGNEMPDNAPELRFFNLNKKAA
ncbi:MAG: porin, partial [Sphingobacteriaceae bacterium]